MPRDDSGLIPLSRDGGYKMIHQEIEKFESNVWMPAVERLTKKVEQNGTKTDDLIIALTQLRAWVKGALWVIGFILAAFEAYEKLK